MTTTTETRPAYDEAGTGEPALLLIPGWCGDRGVFDPVLPTLSASRRSISMDLPEHGESPRTGEDFGTADVVDHALGLVDALGIDRLVPVALSHAGWVAIELRRRLGPERVPAMVLLDWMVLGPPPGFLDAVGALQQEGAWTQVRSGLFAMWTTGLDLPELHTYVDRMGDYGFSHWSRAGREIGAAFSTEGSPLAALARLAQPCPTLHVYAQPADDGFLAAQQGYAAEHSWFAVRRLDARTHFPMFEVPGELAEAVESFVRARC